MVFGKIAKITEKFIKSRIIRNGNIVYLSSSSQNLEQVVISASKQIKESVDFTHIFATTENELSEAFQLAKPSLKKNGSLWISWPKKSSKITTKIDKFHVMKYGLENGLVDVKVAAVDDDWSGHKFVYRIKDR